MDTSAKPNGPGAEAEDDSSINPMEVVYFVRDAVRRNPLTCVLAGLVALALGLAIISALPRKYESTSKVYVSSAGYITSQLLSGRRSFGDEGALKELYESIYSHDNIISLIREGRLVENWPKTRNWFQRIVDAARTALRGPTAVRDMEEHMHAMLVQMIQVRNEDSAAVRFRVAWRDPVSAQKLTQLVERNYIAAKEVEELAAITRATTFLEEELKRADEAFAPAVTELKEQTAKLRERTKPKAATVARPVVVGPVPADVPRPTLPPIDLTAKLNELRNEERAVLEPWQRRTAELKFQLADLRAVYGPAHPTVVQLEAKLKAASAEPVELLDIRQRESELRSSMASMAVSLSGRSGFLSASRAPGEPDDALRGLISNAADDPSLAPARMQLEAVLRKTADMRARLDAARMEMAITQAGFKYRYRQVEPARLWPNPISPKVPLLIAIAVAVALVVSVLAGAARELIIGKVMEEWQVRQLGLPVLARVDVRGWRAPDR